jgi:hypothetical protein
MQFDASDACGSGGRDVDDVRFDRGEVWRKPPKAFDIVCCLVLLEIIFWDLSRMGEGRQTDTPNSSK